MANGTLRKNQGISPFNLLVFAQNLLKLELDYGTNTENNGSVREQTITVPTVGSTSGFTAVQTYTYDDLNRIQSATEMVGTTETWKQTFIIDRYGNRRFNTASNLTTTLGSCTVAVCNPTISTANNRFTSTGYDYDENGNVIEDAEGRQFTYDAENHQTEVRDSENNVLGEYLYDGEGKRVKKISNTETTIFVYNANGTLVAEYSTALATTEQVSYLTADHLGSPRIISNENGVVTDRKDYSAFGEPSTSSQRSNHAEYSGTDELRKGYTGYEKDGESGLDFAQARYFNALHGRFTSVDPLTASASIRNPQTFNRYSYALNSPYKFTDPLGLKSIRPPSSAPCNPDWGECGGGRSGNDTWYASSPSGDGLTMPKRTRSEVTFKYEIIDPLLVVFKDPEDNIEYAKSMVEFSKEATDFFDEMGNIAFDRGNTEAALFKSAIKEIGGLLKSLRDQSPVTGAGDIENELSAMMNTAVLGNPIAQRSGTSFGLDVGLGLSVGLSSGQQVEGSSAVAAYNAFLTQTDTQIAVQSAAFSRRFEGTPFKTEATNNPKAYTPDRFRMPLTTGTLQRVFTRRMGIAREDGRKYLK